MGNLRKDHVAERFVIVNESKTKPSKSKKNPFKLGNESMTNPSVLSLGFEGWNASTIAR